MGFLGEEEVLYFDVYIDLSRDKLLLDTLSTTSRYAAILQLIFVGIYNFKMKC